MRPRALVNVIAFVALLLSTFTIGASASPPPPPVPLAQVEPQLLEAFAQDATAGYLIYFSESPDLSAAYTLDWQARGRYVVQALRETAEKSQVGIRAYLDAQGAEYRSFWIDNVIAVESSSSKTVQALLSMPGVEQLRARRSPAVYLPEKSLSPQTVVPAAVESNLTHIGADQAWALGYEGQGIVVAGIDTGVRYTHNALRAQYRGSLGDRYEHDYNWWDPYGDYPAYPADDHGHGTHTMGTMVGDDGSANQVGVAPGARWIACRACNTSDCTDDALLECAQFVVAPWDLAGTTPDPDRRAHVVNNSWGDCEQSYDGWYQGVVDAWLAAGIYPVFANGNASNCDYTTPPPCGTVGNPARYGNVTGVGSTGKTDGAYASHSNRGPSDDSDSLNPNGYAFLKPQVVAPGVSIRSSTRTGDNAYGLSSGTSMSTPHVTGLVALMWAAGPCLLGDYAATESLIQATATPVTAGLPPETCAGEGPGQLPNQSTGWGEINVLAAVQAAAETCGGGVLTGQAVEAGALRAPGDPIPYVHVEASAGVTFTRATVADALGVYTLRLPADVYTVTGSAYGYETLVVPGVQVTAGTTSTLQLALPPAALYRVTGRVTDAATGWPLYASLTIRGNPFDPPASGSPAWTDPLTGEYGLTLAAGVVYTFSVEAWGAGYKPVTVVVPSLTGDVEVDIDLQADLAACTAAGYQATVTTLYHESFDTIASFPGGGWAQQQVGGILGAWATATGTVHPAGAAPHSGTRLAYFNAYDALSGASARLYRTTGLDLSGIGAARVALWVYHDDAYSLSNDRVQVQLSTDSGASWQDVGAPILRYGPANGWQRHVVDITPFTGSSMTDVRLALLATSGWGNDVHIDDVAVEAVACASSQGGLVVGNVYDGATNAPLPGVRVVSDAGGEPVTTSVTDDPTVDDGFYILFAPPGPRVLTATLAGYGPGVGAVDVVLGDVVSLDLTLPVARLVALPEELQATVTLGRSETVPLTLTNTGGATLTFAFEEHDAGELAAGSLRDATPAPQPAARQVTLALSGSPALDRRTAVLTAWVSGEVNLALDDGSMEDAVGVNSYTAAYQFIWLNHFTPSPSDFPFELDRASVVWPSDEVGAGDAIELVVYADPDGDGDPHDGVYLASFDVVVQVADGATWNDYVLSPPVTLTGPGDVLIGAVNRFVASGGIPTNYPAAIDTSFSHGRSWIGWWLTDPPTPPVLPPDDTLETLDALGLPGNFMIRGSGTQTQVDVPWLAEAPTAGTLPAGAQMVVDVVMDAGAVVQAGIYRAALVVESNDPVSSSFTLPVTMTVIPVALSERIYLPFVMRQ